jgi:hypothetical protein
MRGRTAPSVLVLASKVTSPIESWKNTADMPIVAMARAMVTAMGTPSMPHRVDAERSAAMITPDVVGCSNSRTIRGLKLVSDDCAQSIDSKRSPACQSRRPTKLKPAPWNRLECSPGVNSRIRLRMSNSTSVTSERLISGSTSCSRVRTFEGSWGPEVLRS